VEEGCPNIVKVAVPPLIVISIIEPVLTPASNCKVGSFAPLKVS